ncbi:uncharacterized protein LOC5502806 [Nematostella vectensis]|uniref:uncharacterized protein LOC5502806 n=1 Tax=Nematostella vectensis TaxID=45351 RepID=UPI002076DFC6|nr:uncharacterized protein LOC5502806 [Nematostella vectensis]
MSEGQIFSMVPWYEYQLLTNIICYGGLTDENSSPNDKAPILCEGVNTIATSKQKLRKELRISYLKKRFYASVNNYNRDITAKATKRTPHLVSKIKHDLSHFCTIYRGRTCVGLTKPKVLLPDFSEPKRLRKITSVIKYLNMLM